MAAYYNEIDPYAAAWLRNLIAAGHIADGVVDERSIVDVRPEDLAGFAQVHLFAGLGGWSHAARLAGWPDDRPLWTGSCPCQPFSLAGKRTGTADERHLWPEMHRLVAAIRPSVVVGEQVASRAGLDWLDGVCADLEAAGYATGAIDLCAASVGAPHIRQRLWWVAHTGGEGRGQVCENTRGGRSGSPETWVDERSMHGGTLRGVAYADGRDASPEGLQRSGEYGQPPEDGGSGSWVAHSSDQRCKWDKSFGREAKRRAEYSGHIDCGLAYIPGAGPQGSGSGRGPRQGREGTAAERGGEAGWLADAAGSGFARQGGSSGAQEQRIAECGLSGWTGDADSPRHEGDRLQPLHGGWERREQIGGFAGPGTTGFWSRADWIPCRDGKARPVEPGSFPLAHGVSNRVGRLRAYGNAIVPQVAAQVLIATNDLIANRLKPVANGGTDGV